MQHMRHYHKPLITTDFNEKHTHTNFETLKTDKEIENKIDLNTNLTNICLKS